LFLFIKRDWRSLSGMFFAVVTGSAFAIYAVGFHQFVHYFHSIIPADAKVWSAFPANISLRGTVVPLMYHGAWVQEFVDLGFAHSSRISLAVEVIAGLYALYTFSRQQDDDAAFCLVLVAMLLLSPIAWTHNLVLMVLPLLWVSSKAFDRGDKAAKVKLLLVLIIFSLPTYEWIRTLQSITEEPRLPFWAFLLTRGPTAALIILWMQLSHVQLNRATPKLRTSEELKSKEGLERTLSHRR